MHNRRWSMLKLALQFATGSNGKFLFFIATCCANVMLQHNMQGQGYGPTVMEGYFWQAHSDLHNYLNLFVSPKMSPPLILALLRKSVTWNLLLFYYWWVWSSLWLGEWRTRQISCGQARRAHRQTQTNWPNNWSKQKTRKVQNKKVSGRMSWSVRFLAM